MYYHNSELWYIQDTSNQEHQKALSTREHTTRYRMNSKVWLVKIDRQHFDTNSTAVADKVKPAIIACKCLT